MKRFYKNYELFKEFKKYNSNMIKKMIKEYSEGSLLEYSECFKGVEAFWSELNLKSYRDFCPPLYKKWFKIIVRIELPEDISMNRFTEFPNWEFTPTKEKDYNEDYIVSWKFITESGNWDWDCQITLNEFLKLLKKV